MTFIASMEELEKLYGQAGETSLVKEVGRITPHYRALIEASPFVALATSGAEGLDCSPRGDTRGFVRIADEKTLLMPDRRGNNRIDSLRNVVRDPRVGLLFLIPGLGHTLRVNGRARISVDPALLDSFKMDGKAPRSVLVITVDTLFFQCARAIVRADLWDPAKHASEDDLPTPGQILAALTDNRVGGEPYDKEWPSRARASLW
jgi:PPOX class probable FMN-dependent enzyme